MSAPEERDHRSRQDEDLSDLASSYRKSAPYIAAATQLVVATGGCAALGWWADRTLEHHVPWLLIIGSVLGMAAGFVSFLRTALGKKP